MDSNWKHKTKFPLRLYLKQLFFGSLDKVILSPTAFWYTYQIELLEKCWLQDISQQLEDYLYDNWDFFLIENHWDFYWMYQVERCWERDCIEFLENCWLQEE
ncbi:MAG: hypothetical protein CLLPBCKN_005041 [Chroococcidiopsis cubana SAG 39.79]|jgi:hypothetical protein|uniref:Uncharacterized protein n=2 Tax=Chroococcidiopsis TaxID=54298 RepID=K9U7R7_CHRTP|nr:MULTISPECIES: hypothetical protein [Chroococcidiopsis]MBE9019652.1 hypothetical protein [Chroococcidiopsidales cyanobacterium LEGE 13417]PSB48080.1 hypothetical protein C7B80_07345 [Cyanosarcina cf. burmensis CCALA 770]AFY90658.1 hypothetical protein Chro_5291 [Chroococcidiopsis thermalis PCC 7203]MDZ4875621.1 hypothetical protein [Chroococcidiopsis cubana SAG 39.79]PSB64849.1 hypothetical protein C7B79_08060 [Chroococcidiopsis cubana CCALA 043]